MTVDDFKRILTETDASLTEQYQALLATEGLQINFTESGIAKMAEIAFNVNEKLKILELVAYILLLNVC